MSNEESAPRRHHGPTFEKAKNFKGTIKKLALSMRKFWPAIIISFLAAGIGAIMTIIAPNHLSDLTDELTKGLVPDTKTLQTISKKITANLSEENIQTLTMSLFDTKTILGNISLQSDFTESQKKALEEFRKNVNATNFMQEFSNLDDDLKLKILTDTTYQGVVIKAEDKLALLNMVNKNSFDILSLPTSIATVLLPEFTYDNILITSQNQIDFLGAFKDIKDLENEEVLFKAFDKLPSNIYDLVKPHIAFNIVKHITFIIALLYGINALLTFIENILVAHITVKYSRDLRENIAIKINKLPLKYFDKSKVGDTLSRVTNDVDTISQSMHQSFSTLVSALTLFIGSLLMMFVTNAIMAITAIPSTLFGFVFMSIILSKSQKYFRARQKQLGNINGHIEEMFSGHDVVTLYNGEKLAAKKFDELNELVYVSEQKSHFLSGLMQPFMAFIGHFGYVCVCIVGAILTMNDVISFGVIVAFMMYIRLFTNPLSQLAQAMTSLQSAAAAGERVFEFLEQPEMADESKKTKVLRRADVKGEIIFDHVKFGYDEDKLIIKDFNAHIKPGQKIAIVGPTGAGKTTLVNLLMRFYEINSGDILIDGVSTKELTRDNIHKLFIMVLQDTWLFNGSIKENIRYNKDHVSDDAIKKACEVVGIDHYIQTLPKGINTNINESNSISSGQKQLLTIARGMIEDAPFLILDEATSNVDTRTEELVQKAMDKLTEGRTSFIIAHRLSTIKNADLILVMNEGNIIEQGNHHELMQKNGFYANLYNSQFESISE